MRILIFDMVSIGLKIHFKSLKEDIKNYFRHKERNSISFIFVHADSLYNNKNLILEGWNQIDANEFNYNFTKLLKKSKPDVVITTHQGNLISRALIRSCRKLNIPSIYFQYAFFGKNRQKSKMIWKGQLKCYFMQFLSYFKSSPLAALSPSVFAYLFAGILGKNVSHYTPLPGKDNICNAAVVKAETYKNYLIDFYKYTENQIEVLGNPEAKVYKEDLSVSRKFLYIMQPIVEDGFVSFSWYKNFMRKLLSVCEQTKLNLFLKPHPRTSKFLLEEIKKEFPNIEIVNIEKREIAKFGIALTHNSSLGIIAPANKIPLIVFPINKLDFSDLKPFAFVISTKFSEIIKRIESYLKQEKETISKINRIFHKLESNGIIPNGNFGEKVAKLIETLVNEVSIND